jgi:hypothetical protein
VLTRAQVSAGKSGVGWGEWKLSSMQKVVVLSAKVSQMFKCQQLQAMHRDRLPGLLQICSPPLPFYEDLCS